MSLITRTEEMLLLAVCKREGDAYGMTVRRELEETADRRVSLGAIYATLDRLEDKGLVSSSLGAPGDARRGRAKRFFKVRPAGLKALQASLASMDRMRRGIDELDPLYGATSS